MPPQDPGIKIRIDGIPLTADKWQVKKEIGRVLHDHLGFSINGRPGNFDLKQINNEDAGPFMSAFLIIPSYDYGTQFLSEVERKPLQLLRHPLSFSACQDAPRLSVIEKLAKTFYVDPKEEEKRTKILQELATLCPVPISEIQFGVLFDDNLMGLIRSFSVEWRQKYAKDQAGLYIDYDRRRFRVQASKRSRLMSVIIPFSSLLEIDVGTTPFSKVPYVCFEVTAAPHFTEVLFESESKNCSTGPARGLVRDNDKLERRIGHLNDAHKVVAPYAPSLRLHLYDEDAVQRFKDLCETAQLDKSFLEHHVHDTAIPSYDDRPFFSRARLEELENMFALLDWPVAFQLDSLNRNGLLNTDELDRLMPVVRHLLQTKSSAYMGDLLKAYGEALKKNKIRNRYTRLHTDSVTENSLECFHRVRQNFVHVDLQHVFRCCHATVTPSRLLLEGPYVTQSNRVIRQYQDFQDHFIRVDFHDEDRGRYRSDRDVDGATLLQSRFGGVLDQGLKIGGRHFKFLAYSNSSLREHAVWFMNPFQRPTHGDLVTPDFIRHSLGKFEGHQLLKTPSKYAARIGQAFTSTDASVKISSRDWEELAGDLECGNYTFTDGVGTISKALAANIWLKLCEGRRNPPPAPSAFQIRFLGYKGVVATDLALLGTKMRLRPSMRKFDAESGLRSPIEIAKAFERANTAYLNRQLIMVLEDRGVPVEAFLNLQAEAIEKARSVSKGMADFTRLASSYHLGSSYHLVDALKHILSEGNIGLANRLFQLPFFKRLCRTATNIILREIREKARIPVEGSFHLVGVADEGPEYAKSGREKVVCLDEGQIYVCIQKQNEEPVYMEGAATISRSPITHPGDVQKVWAIGKPPAGCLFGHLKNVVVMPSQGKRPLASCLSGGDLDGDEYSIIFNESLLPKQPAEPAEYAPTSPWTLDGKETVKINHITQFLVQYIQSDLLGLLSDKLLLIADQSPQGMFDRKCMQLSELCSKAVDYPKNGVPVELDFRSLPKPITPDWYAGDVDATSNNVTAHNNFVCESPRALGHLFREALKQEKEEAKLMAQDARQAMDRPTVSGRAVKHPLAPLLKGKLEDILGAAVDSPPHGPLVRQLFQHYRLELEYICSMSAMASVSGETISEEEIVLGSIMGMQKNIRKDRQQRMRENVGSLVNNVRKHLLREVGDHDEDHANFYYGLELSWTAWCFCTNNPENFGSNSFGLIALSTLFYCLDRINA